MLAYCEANLGIVIALCPNAEQTEDNPNERDDQASRIHRLSQA
jgi:hypothetical protein